MANERISFEQALNEIVQALQKEKSQSPVFYLGAGASAAAGLPLAPEFLRLLTSRVADSNLVPKEIDSLTRLGDWAKAQNHRDQLDEEAARILSEEENWILKKPRPSPILSPIHYLLAHLPGSFDIVTTNYDNLIEWHLQEARKTFERICLSENLSSIPNDRLTLLKIHGSINLNGRPESHLIIGRQELANFDSRYPYLWELLKKWIQHRPFVFVGHSLEDENLFRLLVQTPNRDCESFAVDPFPDEIKVSIWRSNDINYIQDANGCNMDAEAFFLSLLGRAAPWVRIEIQKSSTEESASFKDYIARALVTSQNAVGQVFNELNQNLLYEHPEVSDLETELQWGNRAVVLGEGGTGKTALAVMLAQRLQRFRRVYYLTAKETDLNSNEVLSFLETVVPRDLVILDDLHRLGRNLGKLLNSLENPHRFRSNLLLISRQGLLASDKVEIQKFLHPVSGRQVEINASDISAEIVSHRFTRKRTKTFEEQDFVEARTDFVSHHQKEIKEFQEIFGNNLLALAAAVDQWNLGQPVSSDLSYYSLLNYLKELKNELGEEAVWGFLATCAFWHYEHNISLEFLKRIGVDIPTVEALCRRGDLRKQEGRDENKYIGGFHAKACEMYLKAADKHLLELVSKERVDAITDHETDLPHLKLHILFITKSLEWELEDAAALDTHFVYQGYKNDYMDMLEQSLPYLKTQTAEEAKRNVIMWLTLGSIYRRNWSRNFKVSLRCFKHAQNIVKEQGKRGEAHVFQGRLYYEQGYVRFLNRQYIRAALLFRRSYLKDWRPEVIPKRRRYGWMSKLQMTVALWYQEWEWQIRYPWLFSLFPFIKQIFDKRLSDMFQECEIAFKDPKDFNEWRFLFNVLAFRSLYNLYQADIMQKNVRHLDQSSIAAQIEELLNVSAITSREAFKAAREAHVKDSEILLPLEFYDGWLYSLRGDYEKAFDLLKRSTQHAEDNSIYEKLSFVYYLLGQSAEKLGDYAEAKAAYRRALNLDANLNNGFWQLLANKNLRQLLRNLE